jgi:hypothetical protein
MEFHRDDPSHSSALQSLFEATFSGHPYPQGGKSPLWKKMGWQGEDPATDFRGGGLLALECLVHMAGTDRHRGAYLALVEKDGDRDPMLYYPFAAAAVNVTFMLTGEDFFFFFFFFFGFFFLFLVLACVWRLFWKRCAVDKVSFSSLTLL